MPFPEDVMNTGYCCGGPNGSLPPSNPPGTFPRSWNDFTNMCPLDPFELVTYAKLGTTVGEFYNSGNFHQQSTPWGANTLVLTGAPLSSSRRAEARIPV
jgi:hypothetical protein